MLRLLCVGDIHFSKVPPISRDENYPRDILRKFSECISLAKKLRCDYIVDTGDFFHRKSSATFEEAKILMRLFRKSPIPVVGVGGNHDYTGYNMNTMKYRPIGNLIESRHLRLLDLEPIEKNGVVLMGSSYTNNYDISRSAYIKPEGYEDRYTIAITHGSLVLKDNGTFWGHYTNMNDLRKMESPIHNIIFNGHMHHYQKTYEFNDMDCTVFSIGSLARNVLKEDIAKRKPKVLFMKIKEGEFSSEEIILKSARKSDDVFKIREYVTEEDTDSIKEFVNILTQESGELSIASDRNLVRKIVRKFGYTEKVEMKVLDYLENADEY